MSFTHNVDITPSEEAKREDEMQYGLIGMTQEELDDK